MAFPNENQRIIMVSGKGGVGKSAVAAALATACSRKGKRTLLVELGDQSYFSHVYGKPVGYEPSAMTPHLNVALWSGESCLREYVLHLFKIRKIVELFFDNRVMKTFIRAAPALKELAILGKITSGIRKWGPSLDYDVIVVDGYASGHFEALLKAPFGMAELIETGPMGEQSRSIQGVLRRKDLCEIVIACLPEELPVAETVELRENLCRLLGYQPRVICNRYHETALTDEIIARSAENGSGGEKGFARFLQGLLDRQRKQLRELEDQVGKAKTLPFVLEPKGKDVIAALSEKMDEHVSIF